MNTALTSQLKGRNCGSSVSKTCQLCITGSPGFPKVSENYAKINFKLACLLSNAQNLVWNLFNLINWIYQLNIMYTSWQSECDPLQKKREMYHSYHLPVPVPGHSLCRLEATSSKYSSTDHWYLKMMLFWWCSRTHVNIPRGPWT